MSNSSTKIILSVTTDLTYDQRMQRICHSLAMAGFDVLLVGRKRKKSIPLTASSYQQKRINCFFEQGKLFYLEYNIRLFIFLLTCSTDIISSADLDTLLPCLLVAKIRQKKCAFDAHEYFSEVPEVVNRPFIKRIWERVAAFGIPKVDVAYTVSASLQNVFTNLYGVPFQLIRNIAKQNSVSKTVSFKPFDTTKKRQHILFYQGALNEGRGLEALLQIMPKVKNAELWIAGEGDLSRQLKELSKDLNIENKVTFLGYVLPDQLKIITPQATIGLNLLANKGLSYYYSLANKTFDYIQAGIPAIHPNFPEYQLLNQQYAIGLLVEDLTKDNLLGVINKLLQDDQLYHQLQQNCLSAANKLNWQIEEKRLVELYKNLIT